MPWNLSVQRQRPGGICLSNAWTWYQKVERKKIRKWRGFLCMTVWRLPEMARLLKWNYLIFRGRRQSGVMKRGICISLFNHLTSNSIKQHLQNSSNVLGSQGCGVSKNFKVQSDLRTLLSSSFTHFSFYWPPAIPNTQRTKRLTTGLTMLLSSWSLWPTEKRWEYTPNRHIHKLIKNGKCW